MIYVTGYTKQHVWLFFKYFHRGSLL